MSKKRKKIKTYLKDRHKERQGYGLNIFQQTNIEIILKGQWSILYNIYIYL